MNKGKMIIELNSLPQEQKILFLFRMLVDQQTQFDELRRTVRDYVINDDREVTDA